MTSTVTSSYADVNGLRMYYETHGEPDGRPPVVLIHGAFSATGTSWGALLAPLAATRQVISVELQGHGHTADVDRPLRMEQLADDVAALLDELDVQVADVWGYSMGGSVALHVGLAHPEKVRKLVLQSSSIDNGGYHPGHLEAMDQLSPELLHGSPFHEEYLRLSPHPEGFGTLAEKVRDLVRNTPDVPASAIAAMGCPVLTVVGDSDIFRPEHAVEMFRAFGGGVNGDIVGLPESQLAVLPGTTHIGTSQRADLLLTIVPAFLDA
ncbi:alpha/beta fold hydrolase [Actinophytocola gossypii]|uniref:Alpha/beta fold hydrolase n=1 Tax=Actinophytocola gossypii TaxID=2812003 RepID=A0ABT2JDV6_9PSEU|nr:alpha/beta fold hydrolase [Actinophytocola gossypii]MCT2585610.1 alpha/beta fold hydrolase [Actinophytocola gossypii]